MLVEWLIIMFPFYYDPDISISFYPDIIISFLHILVLPLHIQNGPPTIRVKIELTAYSKKRPNGAKKKKRKIKMKKP